jgi:transposase
MELHLLQKQGLSIRQIAKQAGMSRNTVRSVLRKKSAPRFATPMRTSALDAFKAHIEARLAEFPSLSALRLCEEIQPLGYPGGVHQVRRFAASLRKKQAGLNTATVVRFETAPGHQAQADWFDAGTFTDALTGQTTTYYGFIIVLGYSRRIFVTFVTSMRLPVLIACHEAAWRYFGGVPNEVLYDNMKQVRINPQRLQPEFADYAMHCGFAVKTCRPYRPRTKGKVERSVAYVRGSFLTGRSFISLADLNAQAHHWCLHTADTHLHATTGCAPAARFRDHEQAALQPLPTAPWTGGGGLARLVSKNGLVRAAGSHYSVPPEHIGQRVAVRIGATDLTSTTLQAPHIVITTHALAAKPGSTITHEAHLAALWKATTIAGTTQAAAPTPSWRMCSTGQDAVAITPLTLYEQVAAC